MSKNSRRTAARFESSSSFNPSPGGFLNRHARLEHLLLDGIQSVLRDEASDPAVAGVTLLSVQLSPDGGHARVAYAVVAALADEQRLAEQTRSGLARATGFVRARVAQQLNLKKLPRLSFTFVGVVEEGLAARSGGEPCPE